MWVDTFYSYRIKKNQILKVFGPIMQKRAVEQKKYSWSISSNRDQKYNGTIKNDYYAKNYSISIKSYQESDHIQSFS